MSKCITTARLVHDNANRFEGACWLGWFCCYRTLLLPSILTAEAFKMKQQQPTVSTKSHKTNYVITVPQINNGRKLLPQNFPVHWCTKCRHELSASGSAITIIIVLSESMRAIMMDKSNSNFVASSVEQINWDVVILPSTWLDTRCSRDLASPA